MKGGRGMRELEKRLIEWEQGQLNAEETIVLFEELQAGAQVQEVEVNEHQQKQLEKFLRAQWIFPQK
jgi:polyhydroxyalkanoate synthesis regulator phasin